MGRWVTFTGFIVERTVGNGEVGNFHCIRNRENG